eukprot:jgi/Orpsp1_1/1182144/evm.model.c7180000080068.1
MLINNFNVIIILFLITLLNVVSSLETPIKILINSNELNLDYENLKSYESTLNNYFNNSNFNYKNFSLYYYDQGLTSCKNSLIKEWKNGEYDMMILDDQLLFSEKALFESKKIMEEFKTRKPTEDYLLNLSNLIKDNDLSFNNPRVLKDGYWDENLYAIPYEINFDVLYYKNTSSLKNIFNNIKSLTWDDFLASFKSEIIEKENKIIINMRNYDELLKGFVEYINNFYEFSSEYSPEFYKLFYNEKADNLFSSFRNFTLNYTNFNNATNICGDYSTNFYKNNLHFIKEKISNYKNVYPDPSTSEEISISLPPKNISILSELYVVINKYSKVDINILIETSIQLNSKYFQIYKAEHFGSIPTFDISQKDHDTEIKFYCSKYTDICNIIENIQPIYMKDVFKSKYSRPYFEIKNSLPYYLESFIENNERNIINIFENIFELKTTNMIKKDIYSYLIICFIPFI